MADPSTWEILTSIGTLVGGIGALGGAWAAWKAAITSRETSRDALEALAVGMEPAVHMDVYQAARDHDAPQPGSARLWLNVRNSARWLASDVDIEITYEDGQVQREHFELLNTMEADADLNLALRDVTVDWPRREPPESVKIVVRYSDARGIARYEQTLPVALIRGKLPNDAVQLDHEDGPHWRRLR